VFTIKLRKPNPKNSLNFLQVGFQKIMKAMIFSAGFGSRLRPLTKNCPKALIPFHHQPILQWIMDSLKGFGVSEFLMNTHYLAEQIDQFLEENKNLYSAKTSYEEEILGTGAGLFQTKDFWGKEDFFIQNADILCSADLTQLSKLQEKKNSLATLAVQKRDGESLLLADETGKLCGRQKFGKQEILIPTEGKVTAYGFCGIHYLSPKMFDLPHPPIIEFSIIDTYMRLVRSGHEIYLWDIEDAYWIDIGTVESLEEAKKTFPIKN
jgi:MurNAc alpha-1-phosphate uridylyltransferase